jgi:hypothetical protein
MRGDACWVADDIFARPYFIGVLGDMGCSIGQMTAQEVAAMFGVVNVGEPEQRKNVNRSFFAASR